MAATLTLRNLHGQTLASHRLDAPLTLRAEPQVQYLLADDNGLAPNAIAERAGNDLLVAIDGQPALRLENYFLADDSGLANPLLGMNANGQYIAYPITDAATQPAEHLLAAEIASASGSPNPAIALAALGGVALTGAAIANRGSSNNLPPPPEQPQTPYDPNQPPPPADNGNITPPPVNPPPVNPPPVNPPPVNPPPVNPPPVNPPPVNPPPVNPPPVNPPPVNPPPVNPPPVNPPPVNPPPTPAPNNPPTGEVQISGTPEIGKTLTASNTLKDDDGLGQITYRWFANGQEVGQGASYTIQPQDKGKTLSVKAEYTDGKGHAESVASAATPAVTEPVPPTPAPNNPPTGEVQVSGTPEVGQTLTASHTLKDDDGLGTITYKWFANGQEIGQGSTYQIQPSDKGKTLSVKAEYTDGKGHAESVESAATAAVTEPAPPPSAPNNPPTGEVQISGTPEIGQTLTASHTLKDDDGLGTITYKWLANGQQIATGSTYQIQPSDKGKTLSVKAEYTDGKGHAESVESAATAPIAEPAPPTPAPNNPPTGEVHITGTPEIGKTLTASHTLKDDDGLGQITYKWFANGQQIATGSTYQIQPQDKGKTISVKAEYTDGKGHAESVESAATAPIADAPLPPAPQPDEPVIRLAGDAEVTEGGNAVYTVSLDLSAIGKPANPADLLQKLANTSNILFGHQHGLDVSVTPPNAAGYHSDVYAMTGRYPAVIGLDADEWPVDHTKTPQENGAALAERFKDIDKVGGIATLSAHWDNPASGGDAFDKTSVALARILPGGDLHDKYAVHLDTIAEIARASVRADGSKIPIIFRPLHENTGDWFWWGKQNFTAEEFKTLWQYSVDYLRGKGADNLLYAFSPNGHFDGDASRYLETYPGDGYVDVFGYDVYLNSLTQDRSKWLADTVQDLAMLTRLAEARGKVAAFSEFGMNGDYTLKPGGNPYPTFYTDLLKAIQADPDAAKIAYMLTWANFGGNGSDFQSYTPWPGHEMEGDFKAFAEKLLLGKAADRDISVTVDILHDSSDGSDIRLASHTVTIAKGQTHASFAVEALADGKAEGDERYRVVIRDPQGGQIARGEDEVATVIHDENGAPPPPPANHALTGGVTLSGLAEAGHTLHAAHSLHDADGMGAVSYQWLRDGQEISGATGAQYTLGQADVGRSISVRASYTDGNAHHESKASITTVQPAASGSALTFEDNHGQQTFDWAGMQWIARDNDWNGGPPTASRQWSRDNARVNGSDLELSITNADGQTPVASEIVSTRAMGYGSYEATFRVDVNQLDAYSTFGFFTFEWHDPSVPGRREIDAIELSHWGEAIARAPTTYYSDNNTTHKIGTPSYAWPENVTYANVQMQWHPDTIRWIFRNAETGEVLRSVESGVDIPSVGKQQLHFNFWTYKPEDDPGGVDGWKRNAFGGAEQKITLEAFSYTPFAPATNNHAPTAPELSHDASKSFWVAAGQGGAAIGKVSASDADGDAITYHVSDSRFEIAGDTLKLKDGHSVDYTNEKRILLTITARDAHGAETSRDIAVQVKAEGAYRSDNPHAFSFPALADGEEAIVPNAPQITREADGSIVITPDTNADTLHLRYQDASGKMHLVDLAWNRFDHIWYASDPAIRPEQFERTITLAAAQTRPGSNVFASNAAKGIYADDSAELNGQPEPPAALEAYLYAANRGAVTEGHAAHYLVRLNKAASEDLTFDITLTHKDSDASDAALATQSITIRAGERHAVFAVTLADDNHAEGTETYKVSITSASGQVRIPAARASLTGEIRDNDQPRPTFDHDDDNLYYTPANGASAMTFSYHDIDYGAVTLNTWRDAGGTWHISQLNPDKRAAVPTINAQSGTVSIPFAITSEHGSIHAHHDHLADSGNGRNTAIPQHQGWQLDWHDTFSHSLDSSGWTRYGWGWQAPEYGGMGRYYQSNAFTADGALHIRSQYHDGEWSSAGISSGETFSAIGGRWEIRARFPDAKGIGYAFLLWPKSEHWPPEIDFAEGRVRDPQIMATYHWGSVDNHLQDNRYLENEDLTDWHTYGAIVDPVGNTITYTFDGKPWFTLKDIPVTDEALWIGFQSGAQDPNGSFAQYESIDNAIPGKDTPAVSDIEIDWVAHYRPDASPKILTLPDSVQHGSPDADRFTLDGHGVKTLIGFNASEGDLLQLDSHAFPALDKGQLAENAFTTGNAASTADHRLIYNPDNGELAYDPDGHGAALATTIARLDPALELDAQHIHIL